MDDAERNERLLVAMDATAAWPAVRELRAWTEPAITQGTSLLDVGCGLADVAISLAAANPTIAVTGLDSSSEMTAGARERASSAGADITLREGDATSLPFPDHTFDAVGCERELHHSAGPGHATTLIARRAAIASMTALLVAVADRGITD